MFENTIHDIQEDTGLDSETIKKVINSFLMSLRRRSMFLVWQRSIANGVTGHALIAANTTNIKVEDEKFPMTNKLLRLEGNVVGVSAFADEDSQFLKLEHKPEPKYLEKFDD